MITLDQHERDKFATWCEQEAEQNKIILEQMDKLTGGAAVLGDHYRTQTAACIVVASLLRRIETQTI